MSYILSGLALFFGPHFLSYTKLRSILLTKLGEGPYKGIYSLFSVAGLILLGLGYWQARSGPLAAANWWYPIDGAVELAPILIFPAMILLVASQTKGHLRYWLRHPMSLGIFLWALAHLLAGGKIATAMIFLSFLLLAVVDITAGVLTGKKPQFTPSLSGDLVALIVGAIIFAFFGLVFHPYLLNLPVLN